MYASRVNARYNLKNIYAYIIFRVYYLHAYTRTVRQRQKQNLISRKKKNIAAYKILKTTI